MKKKIDIFAKDIECKGNLTVPNLNKKHQIHGGFEYQAITSPNPEKGDTVLDTNERQVLEAKKFVDQNHK